MPADWAIVSVKIDSVEHKAEFCKHCCNDLRELLKTQPQETALVR